MRKSEAHVAYQNVVYSPHNTAYSRAQQGPENLSKNTDKKKRIDEEGIFFHSDQYYYVVYCWCVLRICKQQNTGLQFVVKIKFCLVRPGNKASRPPPARSSARKLEKLSIVERLRAK